jgi:hypothetical protein
MEVPVEPAPILPAAPVDAVPVLPGIGWLVVPALVMPLPAMLLAGGRIAPADAPERSFRTSSEHGAEAAVDSVAMAQWRSMRAASASDGLGLGMVWASVVPANKSGASEASEAGKNLFIAYSFSDCGGELKSIACRDRKSLEQAIAEFCSAAHVRPRPRINGQRQCPLWVESGHSLNEQSSLSCALRA